MNITRRRPQTWWKPSGTETLCSDFLRKKACFLLPSPLQTWKQTYWRVIQTSQSYWACSKLWTYLDGRCVKCGTLWCHFALMKGKQEFVWFRNLTTLILPRFVDFSWIILCFSSHTFIVSLKSWSMCACFMSSQSAIYVKKVLEVFFLTHKLHL